jgi:hypothetical protein
MLALCGAVALATGCGGGSGGDDDDTDADAPADVADTGDVGDAPDVPHEAECDVPHEAECATDAECDDGDPCTTDECDADTGCTNDPVDADGDGYHAAEVDGTTCGGSDCDDSDGDVHPDADPDCDGGDLDCDGLPDDDEDGDGHVTDRCPGGDDCDDGDETVFAGSLALDCSDVDHDCNGHADEDNDDDGWPSVACGGSDCDDGNPLVFPGATEDDCNGVDDNCDGLLSPEEDADMDGWARPACAASPDEADCDDDSTAIHPGATEICDDVDQDCDGSWAEAGADDDADDWLDDACGGEDCNDDDPDVHPGAPEVCHDGVDQDCDGTIDETSSDLGGVRVTNDPSFTFAPKVAWTGSSFGVVCQDSRSGSGEAWFSHVAPDGSSLGSDVQVSDPAGATWLPDIAWTGSTFAVAWGDTRDGGIEIYYAHLDATGAPLGTNERISTSGAYATVPTLASTGSEVGIAWGDTRHGFPEVYFARLSADGSLVGSEVRVTDDPANSYGQNMVWTGSEFGIAFHDDRDTTYGVYFVRLAADGTKLGTESLVAGGTLYRADEPSLAWTGSAYGLAWQDVRGGNLEVFMCLLDAAGARVSTDVRVTSAALDSSLPTLVWTASRFAVAWADERDGDSEILMRLLDSSGAFVGEEIPLTDDAVFQGDPWLTTTPSLFGLVWSDNRHGLAEVYLDTVTPCGD